MVVDVQIFSNYEMVALECWSAPSIVLRGLPTLRLLPGTEK